MDNNDKNDKNEYHIGTLSYTKRGLVVLFVWMLWGDFCFTLMETVVPSILPIKLKSLGSSNTIIALILTTLPGILNTTICPWVSFWSDRYRSRWGRRIPFILFTLPLLTLFLILLGFSVQIGTGIHRLFFDGSRILSTTTVSIIVIGIFMVCFQIFNMFVGSVYMYLFNDVVPHKFLGQFLGLFRVVGGLAGALYNMFVFKYAESHMTVIFVGVAVLYFIGFSVMCFQVKEGGYPPPPEYVDGQGGFWSGLKTFFVECYSIRYYWFMFGMTTFWVISVCTVMPFTVFFIKDIGMTLEQYGKVLSYGGFIGMLLTYPAGIIADRYHPLRVELAMKIIVILLMPLNLIFLVVKMPPQTAYYYYMTVSLIQLPAMVVFGAAQFPNEMSIFPKERFGQFCSAQAAIRSVGTILGGLIAGMVFDGLKWYYSGSDFGYRWIPAWSWLFEIFSFICLVKVYQGWKSYGGLKSYMPPLPEKESGNLAISKVDFNLIVENKSEVGERKLILESVDLVSGKNG
jgi:MFS family permease